MVRIGLLARLMTALVFSLPSAGVLATNSYSVGVGPGCSFPTIQQAVQAAKDSPGFDVVRITRSAVYTAQAIKIDERDGLDVYGGYADCVSVLDTVITPVSGEGGSAAPVFSIKVSSGATVKMRNLLIQNGDSSGDGGGIYFSGDGRLQLDNVLVLNNFALYGGGIYAKGTSDNAELILGEDVFVANNRAHYSGGGVYANSLTFRMTTPGSGIVSNSALGHAPPGSDVYTGGYGGGLKVLADEREARAYVASGGLAIMGNVARYGGGVELEGRNDDARLFLYTSRPANADDSVDPTAVSGNVAVVAGGGLYTEPVTSFLPGGDGVATVLAWDVNIEDNRAPVGAAVYTASSDEANSSPQGSCFFLNSGGRPADAAACPAVGQCGNVRRNISMRANPETGETTGQLTDGAILHSDEVGRVLLRKAMVTDNVGGPVLRQYNVSSYFCSGDVDGAGIYDGLVARNITSKELIWSDHGGTVRVHRSTVADNTIGAAHVVRIGSSFFDLAGSILWQPGKTTLARSGGDSKAAYSAVSELASLTAGEHAGLVAAAPHFVDASNPVPASRNYRLQAGSLYAVDYAPVQEGATDLDGQSRDKNLDEIQDKYGVADLGAYERPQFLPWLYNGDFDDSADGWTPMQVGASVWTRTIGHDGAGAIRFDFPEAPHTTVGRRQCIYVPLGGFYRLNGYGLGMAEPGQFGNDTLVLGWEYRRDGDPEACDAGPPTSSGTVLLGNDADGWRESTLPAYIEVSNPTPNASITVSLAVMDAGSGRAVGAFDDISLVPSDAPAEDDRIFADDFE